MPFSRYSFNDFSSLVLGKEADVELAAERKRALIEGTTKKKILGEVHDADTYGLIDPNTNELTPANRAFGYDAAEVAGSPKSTAKQRDYISKTTGIPAEQLTDEVINAYGEQQKEQFNAFTGGEGSEVRVETFGEDEYGRPITNVFNAAGQSAAEEFGGAGSDMGFNAPWNRAKREAEAADKWEAEQIAAERGLTPDTPTGLDSTGKPEVQADAKGTFSYAGYTDIPFAQLNKTMPYMEASHSAKNSWARNAGIFSGPAQLTARMWAGTNKVLFHDMYGLYVNHLKFSGAENLSNQIVELGGTREDVVHYHAGEFDQIPKDTLTQIQAIDQQQQDYKDSELEMIDGYLNEQDKIVDRTPDIAVSTDFNDDVEKHGILAAVALAPKNIPGYISMMFDSAAYMAAMSTGPVLSPVFMTGLTDGVARDSIKAFEEKHGKAPDKKEFAFIYTLAAANILSEKLSTNFLFTGKFGKMPFAESLNKLYTKTPKSVQGAINIFDETTGKYIPFGSKALGSRAGKLVGGIGVEGTQEGFQGFTDQTALIQGTDEGYDYASLAEQATAGGLGSIGMNFGAIKGSSATERGKLISKALKYKTDKGDMEGAMAEAMNLTDIAFKKHTPGVNGNIVNVPDEVVTALKKGDKVAQKSAELIELNKALIVTATQLEEDFKAAKADSNLPASELSAQYALAAEQHLQNYFKEKNKIKEKYSKVPTKTSTAADTNTPTSEDVPQAAETEFREIGGVDVTTPEYTPSNDFEASLEEVLNEENNTSKKLTANTTALQHADNWQIQINKKAAAGEDVIAEQKALDESLGFMEEVVQDLADNLDADTTAEPKATDLYHSTVAALDAGENVDTKDLTEPEKELVAAIKENQQLKRSYAQDQKTLNDVADDVDSGQDGFIGVSTYIKEALNGKKVIKHIKSFAAKHAKKAEAFNEAEKLLSTIKDGEGVIVDRETKEVSVYNKKDLIPSRTEFWIVDKHSSNLISTINNEATYIANGVKIIEQLNADQEITADAEFETTAAKTEVANILTRVKQRRADTGNVGDIGGKPNTPPVNEVPVTKPEETTEQPKEGNTPTPTSSENKTYLAIGKLPENLREKAYKIFNSTISTDKIKAHFMKLMQVPPGVEQSSADKDNTAIYRAAFLARQALKDSDNAESASNPESVSNPESEATEATNTPTESTVTLSDRSPNAVDEKKAVNEIPVVPIGNLKDEGTNKSSRTIFDYLRKGKKRLLSHIFTKQYNIKPEDIQAIFAKFLPKELYTEKAAKYQKALTQVFGEMREAFYDRVQPDLSVVKDKDKDTLSAYNAMVYLLAAKSEDGKGVILPDTVFFAAAVSVLDWVNSSASRTTGMSKEDIALFLYGKRDADVTKEEIQMFKDMGTPMYNVAEAIGANMMKALGLSVNVTAKQRAALPKSLQNITQENLQYSLGLLAIEMAQYTKIPGATDKTLLSKVLVIPEFNSNKKDRLINNGISTTTIRAARDPRRNRAGALSLHPALIALNKNVLSNMDKVTSAILGTQLISATYYTKAVEKVVDHAKNSLSKLPLKLKKLLTFHHNIAYHTLEKPTAAYQLLSTVTKQILYGIQQDGVKSKALEENIASSENGKLSDIEQMDNFLADNPGNIYFRHTVMNQHRNMPTSNDINLVRSKLHRWMFGAVTKSVSTVKTVAQRAYFQFAVNQAFDVGFDKNNHAGNELAFNKILADTLVTETAALLGKSSKDLTEKEVALLNQNIIALQKKYGGGYHMLAALANLSAYKPNGQFSHDLLIESDATTSGYGISIVQLVGALGEISRQGMRRVGLSFKDDGDTFDKRLANKEYDTYKLIASHMAGVFAYLKGDTATFNRLFPREHMGAIEDDAVLAEISAQDAETVESFIGSFLGTDGLVTSVARAIVKHPFMIINYSGGLSSIKRAMAKDLVDDMYQKLADYQNEYSATESFKEKQRIYDEVAKLSKDIAYLSKSAKKGTKAKNYSLEKHLDKGTLHEFELNKFATNSLNYNLQKIVGAAFDAAQKSILGDLTEIRTTVTTAMEWSFFAFDTALQKQLTTMFPENYVNKSKRDKAEKTNKEQKESDYTEYSQEEINLAIKEVITRYPKLRGVWNALEASDETQTFIDAVKQQRHPVGKRVTLEINKDKSNGAARSVLTEDGKVNKLTPGKKYARSSTSTSVRMPASPGVSALIRLIHNIDSSFIGDVMAEYSGVSLYDAWLGRANDIGGVRDAYNKSFMQTAKNYSIMDEILRAFTTSTSDMSAQEVAEVEARYQKYSFEAQALIKEATAIKKELANIVPGKVDKDKTPKEIADTQKALKQALYDIQQKLKSLTLNGISAKLKETVNNVNAMREIILPKLDDSKAQHMFVPFVENGEQAIENADTVVQPTIEEAVTTPDIAETPSTSRDVDALSSVQSGVEGDLTEIYESNNLSKVAQEIYNQLQNIGKTIMDKTKAGIEHDYRLDTIMDILVGKHLHLLNGISIAVNETTGKSFGSVDKTTGATTVNYRPEVPTSHSQQSPREVYVHELLHVFTKFGIENSPLLRNQLKQLYYYAKHRVTVEDFLHKDADGNIIFNSDEQIERQMAQEQYDSVFGTSELNYDHLHDFLAYGLSNPFLAAKLDTFSPIESKWWDGSKSVFLNIIDVFAKIADLILKATSTKKQSQTMQEQLLKLAGKLIEINESSRLSVNEKLAKSHIRRFLYKADKLVIANISKYGKVTVSKVAEGIVRTGIREEAGDNVESFIKVPILHGAHVMSVAAALPFTTGMQVLLNNDIMMRHIYEQYDLALKSLYANKLGWAVEGGKALKQIFGSSQLKYLQNLDMSHKIIEVGREQSLDTVRRVLEDSFIGAKSIATNGIRTKLTRVFMKTDLATLLNNGNYSMQEITELLADKAKLATAIQYLKFKIGATTGTTLDYQTYHLAKIMTSGKSSGYNIPPNADIINMNIPDNHPKEVTRADVEDLLTLLALQNTSTDAKIAVKELIDAEYSVNPKDNGITTLIKAITAFNKRNLEENFSGNKGSVRAGYITGIFDKYSDMIAAPTSEQGLMAKKGYRLVYEKLNDYGVGATEAQEMSLYVAENIPGQTMNKATFSLTSSHRSGTSIKNLLKKAYTNAHGKVDMKRVNKSFAAFMNKQHVLAASKITSEGNTVHPIYNTVGKIIDYSIRVPDAAKEEFLKQNLDIFEVLPTMERKLYDKVETLKLNSKVIKDLQDIYKETDKSKRYRFIDMLAPEYRELYFERLPHATKFDILEASTGSPGNEKFFIERDAVDILFGTEDVTIKNMKFFPEHLTLQAAKLEAAIFDFVRIFKENVVMKIPIVQWANITSNVVTSAFMGVPITYTLKYYKEGLAELETYTRLAKQLADLDYKIRLTPELTTKTAIINLRKQLVHRINTNGVHDLVDAGFYNGIIEDIEDADQTYRSPWTDKVLQKAGSPFKKLAIGVGENKVGINDLAKQLYMTKETAMYKTSHHVLRTSDFIARYALSKHLREEQGLSKSEAYVHLQELFVNYNIPLHRYTRYIESLGIVSFAKYFILIQRAIIRQVKERPVSFAAAIAAKQFTGFNIPMIWDSSVLSGNLLPMSESYKGMVDEIIVPAGIKIILGK